MAGFHTATIITPTFNKPDQIRDAARCVLAQTFGDWQWWIILDGPTQATRESVDAIARKDERIRVFHEPTTETDRRQRYRPAVILNEYLPRIEAGRICWLADDDLWEPEYLATLCGALDRHPDWDIVFSGFRTNLVLRDGQVVHRYDFADYRDRGLGTKRTCWGEVLSINTMFTQRAYQAIEPFRIPDTWDDARQCDHLLMRALEARFTVHAVPGLLVTNRVSALAANAQAAELNAAEAQRSGISLKRIEANDLEFARRLRNAHRSAFFDDREISAEEQEQWFRRTAENSKVAFYLILEAGAPVGTVSLTDRGDAIELGNLLLMPERRGRGIMEYACRLLMKPCHRYVATVRPENHASRKLLERLGVEFTVADLDKAEAVSTIRRLSLGAGPVRRPGWTTLDADPGAEPDILATIPPLPESVTRQSWDEIELIHFLPLLAVWEAESVLREIRAVLAPGGRLVLEQPDILYAARVLTGAQRPPADDRGKFGFWPFYGDPTSRNRLMTHHWGYSPTSLRELLVQVGFAAQSIHEPPARFHVPERDFRIEVVVNADPERPS